MIDPTKFSRLEITNPRYARQWIPLRRARTSLWRREAVPYDTSVESWSVNVEARFKYSLSRRLKGASPRAVLHLVGADDGSTTSIPVDLRVMGRDFLPERPTRCGMMDLGERVDRELDRDIQATAILRGAQSLVGRTTMTWRFE